MKENNHKPEKQDQEKLTFMYYIKETAKLQNWPWEVLPWFVKGLVMAILFPVYIYGKYIYLPICKYRYERGYNRAKQQYEYTIKRYKELEKKK